jgi:7,8-dihydroneopterin aldolase/epimerase/oxygenase
MALSRWAAPPIAVSIENQALFPNTTTPADTLLLEVHDLEVDVLTGVYSEETHLPQPLRISVIAELDVRDNYAPATPLAASKSYMDLKHAATEGLPQDVHFTLIEAVADQIIETVLDQDDRVRSVEVRIVKLAIAEANERIGITLRRHRR